VTKLSRSKPDTSDSKLKRGAKAVPWAWALLGPWAIYSAIYASQTVDYQGLSTDSGAGGIQMTQDFATGITMYVNTTGYITDAQTMLGPLTIMMMWRYRFAVWTWIPMVFFIVYRAFLGNGRWPMITMTLTLILLQLLRSRKKWFRLKYIAILFPIFILFQSVGFDRNLLRDWISGQQTVIPKFRDDRTWLQKQDNPDFANFEFLSFLLWAVPERSHTYTYFTQYLQLFTEPIPRILWRDKPIGAPIKMVNLNDYGNFIGLTPAI